MADETKIPGADETPVPEAHTPETPAPPAGAEHPAPETLGGPSLEGMRSRVSFRAWVTILPPRARLSI